MDPPMSVLVIVHTESDGALATPALEAVNAARALAQQLATPFHVGLVGAVVEPAAAALGTTGAASFRSVAGDAFAQARYATDVAAAAGIATAVGADLVIVPGTSRALRTAGNDVPILVLSARGTVGARRCRAGFRGDRCARAGPRRAARGRQDHVSASLGPVSHHASA